MARKTSTTIVDEEFDRSANGSDARKNDLDESPLDARMLDLDDEAESPFLRGQKRVPVRRGALPRKAASKVKIVFSAVGVIARDPCRDVPLHQYLTKSWRFRLDSSENISIPGPTTSPVRRSWK